MIEFLSTINVYQYNEFRHAVIERCNVTPSAWCQWINGGSISNKYKPIINEIAQEMFHRPVWEEKGVEA